MIKQALKPRQRQLIPNGEIRSLLQTLNSCELSVGRIDVRTDSVSIYLLGSAAPVHSIDPVSQDLSPTPEQIYAAWKSKKQGSSSLKAA